MYAYSWYIAFLLDMVTRTAFHTAAALGKRFSGEQGMLRRLHGGHQESPSPAPQECLACVPLPSRQSWSPLAVWGGGIRQGLRLENQAPLTARPGHAWLGEEGHLADERLATRGVYRSLLTPGRGGGRGGEVGPSAQLKVGEVNKTYCGKFPVEKTNPSTNKLSCWLGLLQVETMSTPEDQYFGKCCITSYCKELHATQTLSYERHILVWAKFIVIFGIKSIILIY